MKIWLGYSGKNVALDPDPYSFLKMLYPDPYKMNTDSKPCQHEKWCVGRYMTEMAIDPAICLSGWRMRIDNSQEPGDTGRLHVDYAQVPVIYFFSICKF